MHASQMRTSSALFVALTLGFHKGSVVWFMMAAVETPKATGCHAGTAGVTALKRYLATASRDWLRAVLWKWFFAHCFWPALGCSFVLARVPVCSICMFCKLNSYTMCCLHSAIMPCNMPCKSIMQKLNSPELFNRNVFNVAMPRSWISKQTQVLHWLKARMISTMFFAWILPKPDD